MKRGRWIFLVMVGLAIAAAGAYTFVRAAALDDRAAWKPDRAIVAREGMQSRDTGSYQVTWTDDAGKAHEAAVETSPDEARAMVEHKGGSEIEVLVYARDERLVVCPTVGFDACLAHHKESKGGTIAVGAGLALVLFALFRLATGKRPGAL
jgi:hypothetical protein